MAQHAVEITDANFEETVLKSPHPVLVDFWAAWCGPCLAIAPVIEELAQEYQGKVVIAKLNVDENPKVSTDYRITSIPTMLIFKNGQVADKQVGAVGKPAIKTKLEAQLA